MIIHLNGMMGVGKLTVGRLLAERLNARLIDNHLLINLAVAVCERGSADYFKVLEKITRIVLEEIARNPTQTFIFTNALAAELAEDRKRLEDLRQFAEEREIPFVQVLLSCDLQENQRRLVSENRKALGKLTNADELAEIYENYSIYHPSSENRLTIDTTHLSPESAVEEIKNNIETFYRK